MKIDFQGYDGIRDLRPTDFQNINITIFLNPHTPGGILDTAAQIDLFGALNSKWEDDYHFSGYTATPVYRLRKDFDFPKDWECSILVYDWDRHGHDLDQDTWTRFILTQLHVVKTPNICYPTRHGARAIYCLNSPIKTGEQYESKYRGLLKSLITGNNDLITIDQKTWDWTRLFRLPRVVRDGVIEHDRPVFFIHDNLLDIETLKAHVPPKREYEHQVVIGVPSPKYKSQALYWIRESAPHSISGNNGHACTFSVVCQLITRFGLSHDDARSLLDVYNDLKCDPCWSDRELDHKLCDAERRLSRGVKS
jgi:hypothetical protein